MTIHDVCYYFGAIHKPVFFLNFNPPEFINIDFTEGGGTWSVRLFYFQGRVPSM